LRWPFRRIAISVVVLPALGLVPRVEVILIGLDGPADGDVVASLARMALEAADGEKWYPDKPSSLKSRNELLEENILLYKEVLAAREAASITANLVVEQFARMEEINRSLGEANDELQKIPAGWPNGNFQSS